MSYFDNIDQEGHDLPAASIDDRLSTSQFPFQPNPLREKPNPKESPPIRYHLPQRGQISFHVAGERVHCLVGHVALGLAILVLTRSLHCRIGLV